VGAALFWLYIVEALLFTGVVLQTLVKRSYDSIPPGKKFGIKLFSDFATISFTTLSFNMLHVLIKSYNVWRHQQTGIRTRQDRLTLIWKWSINSTLFLDFGNEIVQSQARMIWTETDSIVTLMVCIYMGIEGL
jgi:hypothetical protein